METIRRPIIWYPGHKKCVKIYGIFFKNLGIHVKTLENLRDQVVVVNHCFTSLFGTKGLLSDIVIR